MYSSSSSVSVNSVAVSTFSSSSAMVSASPSSRVDLLGSTDIQKHFQPNNVFKVLNGRKGCGLPFAVAPEKPLQDISIADLSSTKAQQAVIMVNFITINIVPVHYTPTGTSMFLTLSLSINIIIIITAVH